MPLRRLDPGGVAAGLFFLALGLAAIWAGLVGEYRRDLHAGRVAMVEGRGRKRYGSGDDGLRLGYVVGDREFDVSEAGYNALVEGLPYRAYYLPRSGKLVNIEPVAPGGPRATPLRTG